MAKKQKSVQVEIITENAPTITQTGADGWGDKAKTVTVTGKAMEIKVRRPGVADRPANVGDAEFGIRILEDGSIILTSYNSMLTPELYERNLRFKNERAWK